ncbi:MAG: Filamentation induced by cAMP protein fic [Candidatus Gottesmanbacteria bacterium GW2011_GWA1_34_13]|uniref:Filamentation induced by cAMP protein fic n=1 Tax=Candidatus Gottesmanbacteria bacterium GW2011_GWA1_34_13 TaxID=1618434 RepID=A0A0G0D7D0_9BACT|nr:MAG: Filamentation induced by cAMP protein fic [Candidatus Gottesmanbacteria bacterium GW2011_GWA1_34_13]KKQ75836.1 MAG: Filamentation induced by cAMP protein fic [Parcubacteria group bacterium GW2011_GWC1_38_6]
MFIPKYTITDQLLTNITQINTLIRDFNERRFPKVILVEFEKIAREVSTFASTSIEGNPLPLTEVKKVLRSKPVNIRNSEKEVINYNQAIKTLHQQLQTNRLELSLNLILYIHKQITIGLLPSFESGKLRQKPVFVNDPRTGKVVYLPPDAELAKDLTIDLITYVNENSQKVDPLILAGIFHKQMVIIHPFMDGNGRTTRLITKVLLAKMGLNTFNLFSFENYYNQNVTKYFQTVGEYGDYNEISTSIDFTDWLEYFTGGLIDELMRVKKLLPNIGVTPDTQLEIHHLSILEYIKKNNFITDRNYAKLTDRAKATRTLDFQKLIDLDLIERKGKGRSTFYVLKKD